MRTVGRDDREWEAYAPVIERVLGRYLARYPWAWPDVEDLRQEGRIAAAEGIRAWRPDKGASLATVVFERIRGRIRHYLRDKARLIYLPAEVQRAQDVQWPEARLSAEGDLSAFVDTYGADPADIALGKIEAEEVVVTALRRCGPKQRRLLERALFGSRPNPPEAHERQSLYYARHKLRRCMAESC